MSLVLAASGVFSHLAPADLNKGITAYRNGDFEVAYAEFLGAAVTGDTKAQYMLGSMHEDGLGVNRDDSAAARWYKRAATHDPPEPEAQLALAYLYLEGRGIGVDAERAATLFKAAATSRKPQPEAMNAIGALYARGRGVERSVTEAIKWYRRAAHLGHADGMYNLATAYHRGQGITASVSQALTWYRRAALKWHVPSQINLAYIYAQGYSGDGREVKVNYVKAYAWLRLAAATGNNTAEENLEILKNRMTDQERAKGNQHLEALTKELPLRQGASRNER
ncbi:MAG: hypothetical protein GKR94_15845 [Gammaproteobacteria bacterium]|nr:hypothetical protein [Gammaproteobacteria bacterium]